MHPHNNCTECRPVSFEEMVAWFVDKASNISHQNTVERLLKDFEIRRKV